MSQCADIEILEERIGHTFKERWRLLQALTHKSYVNENPELGAADNERLEFLGDAVLGLVIGHLLMERHPGLAEGDLSVMRAQIVSESGLRAMAVHLDLGRWLFLGKGEEQTGGRVKASLLADAFEAVIAAVYLDGGFAAAHAVIERIFADELEVLHQPGGTDHKTRLQERIQARHKEPPRYEVVSETGPDHDKTFEVAVLVRDVALARARGKSKKEAAQRAAAAALECPESEHDGEGPQDAEPVSRVCADGASNTANSATMPKLPDRDRSRERGEDG